MKKIKKFFKTLIKTQFFLKHKFVYLVFPILFSVLLAYKNIDSHNIENTITNIITIIGITGGLLLNFLTILLTDNSTILSEIKTRKDTKNIYGSIDMGTKNHPDKRYINYYYSMYYKIFFLIFSSVLFILLYIISFLGLSTLINFIDSYTIIIKDYISLEFLVKILNYGLLKFILINIYIYFIILYFTSLSHLIFRLYYLFHDKSNFTK